jgi:hypothetical protein
VKLEKNASDTCAMLSGAYGGETVKKPSVFEWHKRFEERHKNMEQIVPILSSLSRILLILNFYTSSNSQPSLLCGNIEAVT